MVNEILIISSLRIVFFSLAVTPVSIITFLVLHHYAQASRPPTLEELWTTFRKYFFKLLIAKAIMWPFILFPSLLFWLPGFRYSVT